MKNSSPMSVNDRCLLSRQKSTKTRLQRQKCAALGNLAMGRATIVQ